MRRSCEAGSEPMTNVDWLVTHCAARCRFYPGRDCPGWSPGGICQRVNVRIPDDEGERDDRSA